MKKLPRVSVDASTDGTTCSDDKVAALIAKAKAVNLTISKSFNGSKSDGFRKVDGACEYSAKLGVEGWTDAEIATAADEVSAAMTGTLEGRRLQITGASISAAFAAHDEEACASGDFTCGIAAQLEAFASLGGGSGTSGDAGSDEVTTAGSQSTAASIVVLVLAAVMTVFM